MRQVVHQVQHRQIIGEGVGMASKPQLELYIISSEIVGDLSLDILKTDTGNARRLREEYGNECRYCLEEKLWYVWNQQAGMWQVDPLELQMQIRTKLTMQKLRNEQEVIIKELLPKFEEFRHKITKKLEVRADETLEEDQQKIFIQYVAALHLIDWYTQSENADRLKKAIEMLRSEPGMAVHSSQFDSDPYLFNCLNGTFDLRNPDMPRNHQREDFCSMQAPVKWGMWLEAENRPLFEAYINRVMPDADKRQYLQRFCGLCLSGLADERTILLWLGSGANGKGVLIRILCGVLGTSREGYATMAAMNSFLQSKYGRVDETRNDLVALIGKRFVAVSESNKNSQALNGALLKCFAGGDGDLTIRGNWESMRRFTPKGKLILATNNEPKIDDDSDGMWDRIKKVWFDVQIPPDERDLDLVNKILANEREAVLSWFLEGWQMYWTDRSAGRAGLVAPACVTQDTMEYRDAQSQVAQFVQDRFDLSSSADPIGSAKVYEIYVDWCKSVGERYPKSQKSMSMELEKYGNRQQPRIFNKRTNAGVVWLGLHPKDMVDNGSLGFEGDQPA